MSPSEERRWRLAVACLHFNLTKADVAEALGKTTGALNKWEERGDGIRKGAITADRIVAAIHGLTQRSIPADALQAGSRLWPDWKERSAP